MIAELESECEKDAVSQTLSAPFSALKLYDEIKKVQINSNVLDVSATLQRNGMSFSVTFCLYPFP